MKIQIEITRPGWLRAPRTWRTRMLLALAIAAVAAVPVAWASHQFADVPNSNPHHDDISGIALAGITTGCNPPANTLYCADQFVRRDQMASFLRRGLGRVARTGHEAAAPTSETPAWHTFSITPALPSGALSGAAGFIKADTTLTVELTNATGCPCRFRAALLLTGADYMTPYYTDVTLTTVAERTHLAMTGAARITTAGAKTVEIRIFRASGSGAANVYGNATATYFPFGSAGGNLLSDPAPTSIGPNATG